MKNIQQKFKWEKNAKVPIIISDKKTLKQIMEKRQRKILHNDKLVNEGRGIKIINIYVPNTQKGLSRKSLSIVNIMRTVCTTLM